MLQFKSFQCLSPSFTKPKKKQVGYQVDLQKTHKVLQEVIIVIMHSVPARDLTRFPEGDDVIASKFERFSVIIGERRWARWVKKMVKWGFQGVYVGMLPVMFLC